MKYIKVVEGLIRYIDDEILPLMNDNQQTGYAILCEILSDDATRDRLSGNMLVRSFLSMDKNGDINIDRLYSHLKASVKRKDKLVLNIPLYGKMTFTDPDIDKIFNIIKELDK
jgi:hypothetical protein